MLFRLTEVQGSLIVSLFSPVFGFRFDGSVDLFRILVPADCYTVSTQKDVSEKLHVLVVHKTFIMLIVLLYYSRNDKAIRSL